MPKTPWTPNPCMSIRENWNMYRAAALQHGMPASSDEFATLWWPMDGDAGWPGEGGYANDSHRMTSAFYPKR